MPMPTDDELGNEISSVFRGRWTARDGAVVPKSEDVGLDADSVRMDATMLYADLADSTGLASQFDAVIASKVIKAYLLMAVRLIRLHGGHIRSFDGDRVMGVFVGTTQDSDAAICALRLNWVVEKLLRPQIAQRFPQLQADGYSISHGVGIDRSPVLISRSGIRRNNDLIWVGRAPNIAAKLAAIRHPDFRLIMTHDVYRNTSSRARLAASEYGGATMWIEQTWKTAPLPAVSSVMCSSWLWRPSFEGNRGLLGILAGL